jgi:hypothetical protein
MEQKRKWNNLEKYEGLSPEQKKPLFISIQIQTRGSAVNVKFIEGSHTVMKLVCSEVKI